MWRWNFGYIDVSKVAINSRSPGWNRMRFASIVTLIWYSYREANLATKQIPSLEFFLIRVSGENKNAVSRRLAGIGTLEDLGGTDAFLLHSTKKSTNSKTVWLGIRDAVGPAVIIQPVLLDEQHKPHYPTGEISVRFNETLSDEELMQFAAKHRLRLRARNEFVPQQAVFELSDPAQTYLPEVVEELTQTQQTKEVWANTLSHYERF